MGRRKADFINLDIEKRRNYHLNRYYKTKQELLESQATTHAYQIGMILGIKLTPEQMDKLKSYLLTHCKFKIK